jgi:transcription termination/antitermination protein NusG
MLPNRWFAIRVKSNREHVCANSLSGRGYEVFLPDHKHPTVRKTAVKPLFPGYLFCRFDYERRLPVLTVSGIVHIVGTGKMPQPIEDDEIAAIRILVKTGLPLDVNRPYTVGEKVRINGGPLAGITGIVIGFQAQRNSQPTLIVSITLLQRSVAVAIPHSWLECGAIDVREANRRLI